MAYPPGPGPHGGAPPPAAPPGYVPAGYAPGPPGGAGPPPRPPKKGVPWLWVGLGCGALLVITVAGGVLAYVLFQRAAEKALENMPELPSALPIPMPETPPPAPQDPAVPQPSPPAAPTAIAPRGTSGSVPSLGKPNTGSSGAASTAAGAAGSAATQGGAAGTAVAATCEKAAACCRLILARAPGQVPGLVANCDGLRSMSGGACQQTLATYKQAASLVGVTCD